MIVKSKAIVEIAIEVESHGAPDKMDYLLAIQEALRAKLAEVETEMENLED